MRRAGILLITVVAVGGAIWIAPASARPRDLRPTAAPAASTSSPGVPRRILVGVEPGARSAVRNAARGYGGRIVDFQAPGSFFVIRTPGEATAWADAIRSSPGIRFAEPDYEVVEQDTVPNDPRWPSLWGLSAINAPKAWDTSTGSSDVVVGVIDSGIDLTHPDLQGRLWRNAGEIPANGIDDEGDGWVDDVHGADCAVDDGDPIDDDGHGTHVAGTIGAAGNDGVGVVGVNWDVRLMALDIFRANGTATVSDITQCLDYAIAHGVRLTNNSWGGIAFSQAEYDAFARARNAGILMVAAAGNTGWNVDVTPLYPAAFDLDNVISVAASQPDDSLVSWSCYGPGSVDIAAPGVGIVSTWPTYLYPTGYWSMDGTSMASPHVAGVAALILSRVPGATYPFLRHALLSSAAPVPSLAGKVASGGRLDASAALSTATAGNALSSRPPTPSLHGGSTVAATWANVDLWWSASGPAQISSFELQRSTDGGTSFVPLTLNPATATEWRQRMTVDGPSYAFRVRATDVRSSVSAWATEPPFRLRYVQESSPTIAYQGSWSSSSMSGALGASVRSASASGAMATISLAVGTQAFGVVFARSPGSGKAEIWVDGSRRATLDLYRGTVQARWLGFGASLDAGTTHTVVVKVLGQKRKAASGTTVSFDATATLASQ